MTEGTPRTIVLIHGLWLTSLSWQHWITRYTERGETVIAPEWPRMNADLETLRRDPSVMNGLGLTEIVDSYDRKIRDLDTPPILMGHSFGGAIVQLLLDRGLGAAGVAIDPAPIKGVLRLPLSALKASAPALTNPLNRNKTVGLTKEQWHFAFTNTLSKADSDALYDEYHVPSTARPLFQAATANFNPNAATKVNFKNDTRAPLLIIAGGADHTVPPAMTKENYQRYKSNAVTDYYEFPGRPHFTGGVPGWEEVADYALDWALKHS
ncbi:alpha/beta hydrolase [Kribbella sp. VKM Ac-2568]|uniref:alpha/beta hydrolase n=1 Tax=Kribbella sp. VKM Ac-2568 TaxID=2512219 RepID=UPI001051531B|nr:alpha/beta fold hydrolase [Kribbella sp. VKM Ac-2568]TCM45716.1 alpha-beta hydrolase superfamily lysophospholipase [Kribbella sp. VKM Ac-2568]